MPGKFPVGVRNAMLDGQIGATTYVALFTDARGGTPSTEATTANCPGYARRSVTHAAAASGVKATSADAVFTATGAWATVRYVGVYSAVTGGTLLYWSEIGSSSADDKTLANAETLTFASGQLNASVTDPA